MRESSIILVLLLQAAGEVKYRPAVVPGEMPMPYRDLLVCGVSTRLNQYVQGLDDIISLTDVDFTSSGLHSEPLIRLSFLGVIPGQLVHGILGNISEERYIRLLQRLIDYSAST